MKRVFSKLFTSNKVRPVDDYAQELLSRRAALKIARTRRTRRWSCSHREFIILHTLSTP